MRSAPHLIVAYCLVEAATSGAFADPLPTTERFDAEIRKCVAVQSIAMRPDLIGAIINIYVAQRPEGAVSFKSPAGFLELLPKDVTLEAYRLYRQCISPILATSDSANASEVVTLTCFTERDLSGNRRREEIVLPLNCPPEVEQGYDFTISGSYACGDISKQEIVYNEHRRPSAVTFNSVQGCFRRDDDSRSAQNACVRNDSPPYKAWHTCFVVSFHVRK